MSKKDGERTTRHTKIFSLLHTEPHTPEVIPGRKQGLNYETGGGRRGTHHSLHSEQHTMGEPSSG